MGRKRRSGCLRLALLAGALFTAAQSHAGQPAAVPKAPPSAAAATSQPKVSMPDEEGLLVLIRTAILSLNDAVQTGNFTVLRDAGAPSFYAANNAARLAFIFQQLSQQGADLSTIAVITPQIIGLPSIDASQRLHVAGYFPGRAGANTIGFDLMFEKVGSRWRIFGLSVKPAPSDAVKVDLPKFAPSLGMAGGGAK